MGKIVVGILAHVDAGKTTLSEGMLYTSGAIRTMGRVDNRDAFLDTYALERERGITIFSKQAVFPLGTTQVTLLDTPGHVDFSPEMERTLQVLDYAILVISGADGVQGHTRTLWNLFRRYEIPTFVFVNKMDQEGTDAEVLLQELKTVLEEGCVNFSAKRDAAFYEEAAVCSEDALEEFLDTGRLKDETIQELFLERQLFPCFFGSALRLEGVKEFLEQMQELIKIPKYSEVFGAKVFKIARDEAGNRLTYLKITGGSLKVKSVIEGQKVNQIRIYSGEKYEAVNEAEAGSICALTGLSDTYPGEGLGAEQGTYLPVLEPVLNYQVIPTEGDDPILLLPKLRELEEEEPQLHIVWEEALQEIHVQLMGEVQLEKLQEPEEFMKDCAKELAARLLRMVVQRTPADTGTLRRAWTAGTSSEGYANSVQVNHSGNVYEIAITNPKEYASYVEYGHRTPNHKGWVPGKFMMKISEEELERIAPAILEQRIYRYFGGLSR